MSAWADARFARARDIADAVLWEGYVLYPYRRSATKNQMRFQWGVVGPAPVGEPTMAAEVLVDTDLADRVAVRVRFLQLHRRDDGWDEAVDIDRDFEVPLLESAERWWAIEVPGGPGAEQLTGGMRVSTAPVLDGRLVRIRAEVDNTTAGRGGAVDGGGDPLLQSFVGCHLLFAADEDAFLSLLDPPEWAAEAAAECRPHRCWPVLVGPAPARDLVLASPVILYDHVGVAPESQGDFFDGTEIDEMLTLRVQTLTDAEKAEARAIDPRAAAIIDRCEQTSPEAMLRLHGAQRDGGPAAAGGPAATGGPADPFPEWSEPGPAEALVGDKWVRKGSKVRLRPVRRADAHDLFLVDRVATVVRVVHDVDDEVHVAVTVDDDPAAELFDWHGRYLYFAPDELEPLESSDG